MTSHSSPRPVLQRLARDAAAFALVVAGLAGCDAGSTAAPDASDRSPSGPSGTVTRDMAFRYGLPYGTLLSSGSAARRSIAAGDETGAAVGDGVERFGFEEVACTSSNYCLVEPGYRGAMTFTAPPLPGLTTGAVITSRQGVTGRPAIYNSAGQDHLTLTLSTPRVFRGVWVAEYQDAPEFWIEGYLGTELVGTTRRLPLTGDFQLLEADFGTRVDRLVMRRRDRNTNWYPTITPRFTSGWYYLDDFVFGPPASSEPILPPAPADRTPPVITARVTGIPGADGWYTSDVRVTFSVEDAESPVVERLGCDERVVAEDTPGTEFTCTAVSAGGSERHRVTVRRDTRAPEVRGVVEGDSANGWYSSDVNVSWIAFDGGQPIATTCDAVSIRFDTPGRKAVCEVSDAAGNTTRDSVIVRRDRTAPTVRYSTHAAVYSVDQRIVIRCTAADELSGLASDTCQNLAADAYTRVGITRLVAGAVDRAGNTGSATTTFTVRVTDAGVCALTQRWVAKAGIAHSLCVKLANATAAAARGNATAEAGLLNAFVHEVQAQTGKAISTEHAAALIRLVGQR